MKPLSVSFVGAGNVAWHLAPALDNVGYAVREVYSVHSKNAIALADRLYQCKVIDVPDFSQSSATLIFLAVPDDEIGAVARRIVVPPGAALVHVSGSQPLSVLGEVNPRCGVFYPLQTFTRGRKIEFGDIHFFVESEDAALEKVLLAMGKALSGKVHKIGREERQQLHLSAVFAANFTNHMLALSKEIAADKKLSFDFLKPLIAETINKAFDLGPEKSQTGPARRGDLQTLDRHYELLKDNPAAAEIYKAVSQDILDRYAGEHQ